MSDATEMAAKRAARREKGLCTECDTPRLPGKALCARHDAMQQKRMAKYNGRRHARNLCYCGQPRQLRRTRCSTCLEIEREKALATAREREAAGLCRRCGEEPVEAGGTVGRKCKKKRAEEYADKRIGEIRRRIRELIRRDLIPMPARLKPRARFLLGAMVELDASGVDYWRRTEGAIRKHARENPAFEGFVLVTCAAESAQRGRRRTIWRYAFLVFRQKARRGTRLSITFIPTTTEAPWEAYG